MSQSTFDDIIPDFPAPGLNFREIILTNPWADFRYRSGASFCPTSRECERPNVLFYVKSTDGAYNNGLTSPNGKTVNAFYATCTIKRLGNDPTIATKVVFDVIHPTQPDRFLMASLDEWFLVAPINPSGSASDLAKYGPLYSRMQFSFRRDSDNEGKPNPCPETPLTFSSPFPTGSQIECKNSVFNGCSPRPARLNPNATNDIGCLRNILGNTVYRLNAQASSNCLVTFSDIY
jgi:hypothetical protein